jgi:hypothetical protein
VSLEDINGVLSLSLSALIRKGSGIGNLTWSGGNGGSCEREVAMWPSIHAFFLLSRKSKLLNGEKC